MNIKALWITPKTAALDFSNDDASTLSAALAFYAVLSLAPLLVLAVTVLGLLGGDTQRQVIEQTKSLMGPEASRGIDLVLSNAHAHALNATISTLIGLVVLLVSATTVFAQLQYSLNRIFNVRAKRGTVREWLHKRLSSLLMMGGMSVVIMSSIVTSSIISFAFHDAGLILRAANIVVPIAVFTLLFAIMFRILPDVKISARDTWIGGLISGILFFVGSRVIGWYLASQGTQSLYGAAGTLIVLLLWLYYSAAIMFFGAELTQAYASCFGRAITPNESAEWDPSAAGRRECLSGKPEPSKPS
jgi:membrane protein